MCKYYDFIYIESGNLYLEEQGRASLPSKWRDQNLSKFLIFILNIIYFYPSRQILSVTNARLRRKETHRASTFLADTQKKLAGQLLKMDGRKIFHGSKEPVGLTHTGHGRKRHKVILHTLIGH